MSSEERGSGLICKTASSFKSTKKALFKKSKAKELFGLQIQPLKRLMSCFDRDQSIVIQRRGFSGPTPKVGRSAPATQEKDGVVMPNTPASSQENRLRPVQITSTSATIKLKNLKERMKESTATEDEKVDLEIEYADCLCNLGRYREASLIYAHTFSTNHGRKSLNHDRLKHFIRSLTKVTTESVVNSGVALSKLDYKINQTDESLLVCLPGQTCPDPLSCPVCAGVLCNPISLPCGHTFCRKCILKTQGLHNSCLKCGAPWQPKDCLLPDESVAPDGNVINHVKPNVLIGKLVQKFWSDDLLALELKAQGNNFQHKGSQDKAIEMYTQALKLAPNDHFLYGNRSLAYHKMGKFELALQDAIKATEQKPDWAKGYFRKGSALQALGRHEEAFQSFYECLTLEDEKSLKQVKHELSQELFIMLTSNFYEKSNKSSTEPLTEYNEKPEGMDMNDPSRVIPLSMVALVEFASSVYDTGIGQPNSSLPTWMTRAVTPFKIERRPIKSSCGADSQDFECPLCIQVMVAPVTTPCGHTFCRRCLDRSLDHSAECPMCKSTTLIYYLAERRDAINEFIHECMKRAIPEEYGERERSVAAELMELAGIQPNLVETTNEHNIEEALSSSEVPIFVCTISFPSVRCPLHIFEPRYRLMIRRTMEVGTRQFGITANSSNQEPYAEYGTMLEICDIHNLRDGRSVIDTKGRRRFRVLERRIRDGYNVASVDFLKDDPVAPACLEDLKQFHNETLEKTREWFHSIPQEVRERFESHYGDMPHVENEYWNLPNGPGWHWWTMTILPLDPAAQVNVLSLTSLKKRLELIQRILKYLQSKKD